MNNLQPLSDIFYGVAQAYPVLIPFSGIIYGLLGESSLGFAIATLAILGELFTVFILKGISKWIYQHWYPTDPVDCQSDILRPRDGHPRKQTCGLFSQCQEVMTEGIKNCLETYGVGMPSGHAQNATSMTLVMIMIILAQPQTGLMTKIAMCLSLLAMMLWVIISRVLIKCHSVNQVLVGSMIGYMTGMSYYYLLKINYPNDIEDLPSEWEYAIWIGPPVIYLLMLIYYNFVH